MFRPVGGVRVHVAKGRFCFWKLCTFFIIKKRLRLGFWNQAHHKQLVLYNSSFVIHESIHCRSVRTQRVMGVLDDGL